LAAFAAKDELTLEIVFTPAGDEQQGGTIAAFADEESRGQLPVDAEGRRLAFVLRTKMSRLRPGSTFPITRTRERLHLVVAYREGVLTAYLNGAAVAYHKRDDGSLARMATRTANHRCRRRRSQWLAGSGGGVCALLAGSFPCRRCPKRS
jgi:hypothetical protein